MVSGLSNALSSMPIALLDLEIFLKRIQCSFSSHLF
eukprot:UN10736